MPIPRNPPPAEAPSQPIPRRGEQTRERVRQFWQRVTEGMELEQLWQQFKSEARASYGLYSREVDWDAISQEKRWKRPLRIAWALFLAMLMKLSPARRVLLLLACALLLFVSDFELRSGASVVSIKLGSVGVLILFLLLALELADRVTMKRDLEIAREIQRWLVPEHPPQAPGADIAFASRPANTVAGDYYDAFFRPASSGDVAHGPLLMVVADVAGKSVPAALLMATFQASLQTLAATPGSLAELVTGLNRYACAHSLDGRRFTTAFFGELDPETRNLTYLNAGHNDPIICRASGSIERLTVGGLPLGIPADENSRPPYESAVVRLGSGDLLVIYTDGLVEAVKERGEEYGESRMLECVRAAGRAGASETLKTLLADVDYFVGPTRQHDDITCLVLRSL